MPQENTSTSSDEFFSCAAIILFILFISALLVGCIVCIDNSVKRCQYHLKGVVIEVGTVFEDECRVRAVVGNDTTQWTSCEPCMIGDTLYRECCFDKYDNEFYNFDVYAEHEEPYGVQINLQWNIIKK